jgi:hypothetical protein
MKPSDYPLEVILQTLDRIIEAGRTRDNSRVVHAVVFLETEQLRHIYAADRMVDDYVAFRHHADRPCPPMEDVRALLKRIFEHGKTQGREIDHLEADGVTLSKVKTFEVAIEGDEFALIRKAYRVVDEKAIIQNGEKIVAEVKAKERAAKAKAARAKPEKSSE